MDKKTLSLLVGLALLIGFFLAFFGNASGLDLVKSAGDSKDKLDYLLLVFPISGLMLLVGALQNGRYPGGKAIWCWLPLLTLLFLLIIYPMIKGVDAKNVFSSLGKGYGIGLWITIVASFLAAFANPRR